MSRDPLNAEVKSAIEGLRLTWDMGFRNIIIEIDFLQLNTWFRFRSLPYREGEELCDLLIREWSIITDFVHREDNHCADHLAHLTHYVLRAKEKLVAVWINPGLRVCIGPEPVRLKRSI